MAVCFDPFITDFRVDAMVSLFFSQHRSVNVPTLREFLSVSHSHGCRRLGLAKITKVAKEKVEEKIETRAGLSRGLRGM